MKLKNIILPIVAVLMVSSCDFLDKMPDDQKTMDMVWKSRKETEGNQKENLNRIITVPNLLSFFGFV